MADPTPPSLSTRALCDLDDVKRLVPGYEFDETTEYALIDLVNAQSDYVHGRTGREIKPIAAGSSTRIFDLTPGALRRRKVRIGDCATITLVELVETDGTLVDTVDAGDYIELPRTRESWRPIRQLWFPIVGVSNPVVFSNAQGLRVTGTWGYPEVPESIRGALAKLVIVRYVTDVTARGTEFADELGDINIAGLLRTAYEAIDAHSDPPFA